jgi:hypothetical protein
MASEEKTAAIRFGERVAVIVASERFREFGCISFILALATTMLFPVFRGDWPIGHDHPVHIFRIWQLRETLLHQGLPWGWSHRWFAGYPQNVVYPVGADFLVLAVQALSFGTLSLGRAYGLAFWLFYFLFGYAVFFFVSRTVRSRIAGLIAVIFALTDPGSNEVGGWFWVVDVGVWTSALGLVPALIGTVRMASLLENPKPRTAAAVGLCLGLALLCHQIHLIYFGIAVPLLCLSRYLAGAKTDWPRALALLAGGMVTGFLIASIWLVPYLAAVPYASEIGGQGNDLAQIGNALESGALFPRMPPLATAFGLIGVICLLRARRTLPRFIPLFIFAVVVGSSSSFAALFGKAAAGWMQNHVIAERLLLLVKPFWYGAAAFLVVGAWGTVDRHLNSAFDAPGSTSGSRPEWARPMVLWAFVVLFVTPVLGPAISVFCHDEILRPTMWHSERDDLNARKRLIAWMRNEIPPGQFFRIAHGFDYDDHDLTDLGIELPYPLYKIWHMPTGHFKYDIGSNTNAAFRAANVRFALLRHALKDRPDFTLVKIFGRRLWLYEFRDWNPEPFQLQGTGNVQLLSFNETEITLRADEAAHGLLRLNVSYFPKWHATRDNIPVAITPVSLPGIKNSGFMQTVLAPGTYRFRFQRVLTDYLGTAFCGLGVALCLILANGTRLQGWLARRREQVV